MHELSLVRSLLRQVEQVRAEHGGLTVETILIEVGPLSGVEPLLVESAFQQIQAECGLPQASLVVAEVPLTALCEHCGEVAVDPVRIDCPSCGNRDVRIVGGDSVRLESVTLQFAKREEQPA